MKIKYIEIDYEWEDEEYDPAVEDDVIIEKSVQCTVRVEHDGGDWINPPDTYAEIIDWLGDDFNEHIENKILEKAVQEFWSCCA